VDGKEADVVLAVVGDMICTFCGCLHKLGE